MSKQLEKIYDPKNVENRLYNTWSERGYFKAPIRKDKEAYSIVMPPPNITGKLHMGHALDATLQDILIRFHRMIGKDVLWLPGTDHAAIATEAKIVQAMSEEGITKEEIGREKFLERAWLWKETYGSEIVNQLKKIGCSCDWSRERFTMDEGCNKAVNEVFVHLYNKGLIYRGERIINWCTHCNTSISDAEVDYMEQEGSLWHIRYRLVDSNEYLEIATTRPETMLGDTALAVHPNDPRYKNLIGKQVIVPLVNRTIPVIADEYVEIDFGTGVVKITPAHDPNDFEVGVRHGLPVINVIDTNGFINQNGGNYQGQSIKEARSNVVKDLEKDGLLVKEEKIKHNVGTCYRCSSVIEPLISKQWFVKMQPLATPAIEEVRNGNIKFVPDRFSRTYFHWMENIKDWCISRQIWWGHRIPAYYCQDCGELIVSKEPINKCTKCNSANIVQDPDTLDTWFSSALWPFSTMGWPEDTEDYKHFYPTDVLVTGYDIIFFWVARMIFCALEHTEKIPFHTVFIHGIVRDSQGRKMSKSLGNGINPLNTIDEFGADALRFSLASGISPGNDIRYSEEKIKSCRNFCNKIWNANRFILMNLSLDITKVELPESLSIDDKWLLSKYNTLIKEVTGNIESFELGVAAQKVYDFIWDIFCDWYIELSKPRIQSGNIEVQKVLLYVMSNTLKLLHPFMPFITEEIWQTLPHEGESIMVSSFPQYHPDLDFCNEEKEFQKIVEAIRNIRNIRTERNVPPGKKINIFLETVDLEIFNDSKEYIKRLCNAVEVTITDHIENMDKTVSGATDSAKIFIPIAELVDKEKELQRLTKEKEICEADIQMISGKLANKGFIDKAPALVVQAEREKLEKLERHLLQINELLKSL